MTRSSAHPLTRMGREPDMPVPSAFDAAARRALLATLALVLGLSATTVHSQSPVALTLGDAVRLATARSATADLARQQVATASARARQARAALLPQVSATVERARWTQNSVRFGMPIVDAAGQPLLDPTGQLLGPARSIDARATVRQALLDPAALARVRAAHASVEASRAEAASMSAGAAVAAATAYVDALRAEERLEAIHADSALAAELAIEARRRHAVGLAAPLDVTRAEAQVVAARATLVDARATRDRAHLALRYAVGLPLETPLALAGSLDAADASADAARPDTLPGSRVSLAVQRALRRRAEVRSADAQLTAAVREGTALRAQHLPALSVVADRGAIGGTSARMLGTYAVALQLSVPLFDGLRRAGQSAEQAARIAALTTLRRDLDERVALEVRSARLMLAAAQEAYAAADERARLAERELMQARDRSATGVVGNADVIAAQVALAGVRAERVDRLADVLMARIAVAASTGAVNDLR